MPATKPKKPIQKKPTPKKITPPKIQSRRFKNLPALLFAFLFALGGTYLLVRSFADPSQQPGYQHVDKAFVDVPERGLKWAGLRANANSALCKGKLYEVLSSQGTVLGCTHGPDPSPEGVNAQVSVEPLTTGDTSSPVTAATVPCDGDGISGKRIQIVYAHSADVADRYDTFASSFPNYAAAADNRLFESAAQTGGVRHFRFVTDASCKPTVTRVTLSATGDDSYSNTVDEMKAQGYNSNDRKYLIYVDANLYCGLGSLYIDDSVGQFNANSFYGGFTRVDSGCWGGGAEAHELMHNLGGVQPSAPHGTAGAHCTDEYDRMCYSDNSGVVMSYPCANSADEEHFDCNKDDYFNTNAPAGSYLATHWNTANSAFLIGAPATTTSPPPPTPTTDTTAPVVSISSPASGSTIGRKVTIDASATDNVGVTSLTTYIDGVQYSTTTSSSSTTVWSSSKASRGAHNIVVKSKDAAGNIGQTSITVYK